MASFNKFNKTVLSFGTAGFNFSSDSINVGLSNTAPNATNNQNWSDITEIAAGNGYSAGGAAVGSVSWTQTGGVATLAGNAVTWTASGGSIGPFQYAVLYDATSGKLLGWWDYGSALTITSGNSFTVKPNNQLTGGTLLTLA